MPRSPGRTGHAWRKTEHLLRYPGVRCHWCGHVIDIRRPEDGGPPHRSPPSFSRDHIVKLEDGGHPTDPANQRPMHFGCNSQRENAVRRARLNRGPHNTGAHSEGAPLGVPTSRRW